MLQTQQFDYFLEFMLYITGAKTIPEMAYDGAFRYWTSRSTITQSQYSDWKNDLDHGLVHGLCTAYHAWAIAGGFDLVRQVVPACQSTGSRMGKWYDAKDSLIEQTIYSCLFHDLLKCGVDEAFWGRHDARLKDVLPHCTPDTYNHATTEELTAMVQADRIELMRFPDYKDWADGRIEQAMIWDPPAYKEFYEITRPCIERMVEFHESVWYSHFPELNMKSLKTYPHRHWMPSDSDVEPPENESYHNCFSVNEDSMDFNEQKMHTGNREQYLIGLIPKELVHSAGARVVVAPPSTNGRPHPMISYKDRIPLEKWIFVYLGDTSQVLGKNAFRINIVTFRKLNRLLKALDNMLRSHMVY